MKMFHPIRLIVFLIATVALAKFFEAGRIIAFEQTFVHVLLAVFSLSTFLLMLLIMGYWVYSEEKGKDNLRIKFDLYEWIYKIRSQGVGVRSQKK